MSFYDAIRDAIAREDTGSGGEVRQEHLQMFDFKLCVLRPCYYSDLLILHSYPRLMGDYGRIPRVS